MHSARRATGLERILSRAELGTQHVPVHTDLGNRSKNEVSAHSTLRAEPVEAVPTRCHLIQLFPKLANPEGHVCFLEENLKRYMSIITRISRTIL